MSGFTKLSKILAKSNGNIFFECPGCGVPHGINCGQGTGPAWSWDGDVNEPTFSPSILVSFTRGVERENVVCHSFVVDGEIRFLNDCTHHLSGKIVNIPEWDTECGEES